MLNSLKKKDQISDSRTSLDPPKQEIKGDGFRKF